MTRSSIGELAKSTIGFSWAMSLFALKQIENALLLCRPRERNDRAEAAFPSVTRAIQRQFTNRIGEAFGAGDQLQRGVLDLVLAVPTLEVFTPRGMMKVALDIMQQSAQALTFLMPGRDNRIAWQELKNKIEAFELFEYVEPALPLPLGTQIKLAGLVAKASALDPYPSLWAMEGVGHYYAEKYWQRDGTSRNLLTGADSPALPNSALLPLHSGMGLSFASRLLHTINLQGLGSETQNLLQQFCLLCEDNSREGYVGVTFESLGLVARTLFPQTVQTIDRHLSEMGGGLVDYFWHGVGRGIYFAPTNFLPWCSAPWRAVTMSQQEPPHESGRLNATAGLAFALTLVNIRHPKVLESFLAHHGRDLSANDAFSNGVGSAIMIWRASTQDQLHLAAFREHQPCRCVPGLAALWNSHVKGPCEDALQHRYRVLAEHGRLQEAFRYASLPDRDRLASTRPRQQAGQA